MKNICKVCGHEKKRVFKRYYLGIKEVWECRCGCKMVKDPHWYNYPAEGGDE